MRTPTSATRSVALFAALSALATIAASAQGCGPASATCVTTGTPVAPPADPLGATAQCTTGKTWACLNTGANFMNPGQACVACHTTRPGAPRWTVGGTVYASAHEPDNCLGGPATGSDPVTIVATDSTMTERTATMVPGGNFFFETTARPPFTNIRVRYQGRERQMFSPATTGDCNSCHTVMGMNGAPGRIVLP
jgi:hypothetical protein